MGLGTVGLVLRERVWTNTNVVPSRLKTVTDSTLSEVPRVTTNSSRCIFFVCSLSLFPLLPRYTVWILPSNSITTLHIQRRSNNTNNYFCLFFTKVPFFSLRLSYNSQSQHRYQKKGGGGQNQGAFWVLLRYLPSIFLFSFFFSATFTYVRKYVIHLQCVCACVSACLATKNNSSALHDSAPNKKTTAGPCCCKYTAVVGISVYYSL